MPNFDIQLEKIQSLIDHIQHHWDRNQTSPTRHYEELLELSTKHGYSYGEAFAHVCFAQYAQAMMEADVCNIHLEEATKIAQNKNYFDIMIKCLQVEGKRNRDFCDEMAALSNYLEGVKLAEETKERKATFLLLREIAEVFSDCGDYKDAEEFYQKALNLLTEYDISNQVFYRKDILVRLLRLACTQKDLDKAQRCWKAYFKEPDESDGLPLSLLIEEARMLLLQRDKNTAKQRAEVLLEALRTDNNSDNRTLITDYMHTIELFLDMPWKEPIAWCCAQIEELFPNMDQTNAIRFEKLRVQYAEQFNLLNDKVYENFYQVAYHGEKANRVSMAEVFHSMITLYETAKEQSRMIKVRSDLQIAVNKDELTQIYNRRYYGKLISKYLLDNRVSSVGCIMIDVDFFKGYNDYYGHPKGDEILKEVASTLDSCLPSEGAYAARYGGDEFSCLFIDQTEDEMIDFVKKVQAKIKAKQIQHIKNRNGSFLTLSLGIYCETDLKNCDKQKLLKRADDALYLAKEKGRNTYATYVQRGDTCGEG